MLEQMRQQSRSLVIYVLFGIVIAVFIINFGPQSPGGCNKGRAVQSSVEGARVKGHLLSRQDYMYGMMMVGAQNIPPQRAKMMRLHESIMDMLIDREIMASEAERAGFRVTEEEVEDFISESKLIGLGREQKATVFEKDGVFSDESFGKFVRNQFGMTPRSFIEQQRRELLANRMRESLRAGVAVSPVEVKDDWTRQADQVNVEYLRFPVRRYESEIEVKPEDLAKYAAANEEVLKKLYDERKAALYEKQPKQRHLRQILVKLKAEPKEADVTAAQKKAEGLAARIRKGEGFAKVAKAASEDERTKARGGDLGWQRAGGSMFDPDVDAKVTAAKDGELVGPVKTASGFVLVLAEATREGTIEFAAAKLELAESKLREEKSHAMAKAEAEAALAKIKAAPDKSLKDLYPASEEGEAGAASAAKTKAVSAEETGLFSRRGSTVAAVGKAPILAKAIFALTKDAPVAGPIEELGSYMVVKLKERKEPDLAEFEKNKVGLIEDAAKRKSGMVVMEWALQRCREARDAKQIEVNADLLRYEGGPEGAVQYEPCSPPQMF
ncbi:MAG TPA: SurA N-terminal domain-containing protein [Polyangia bacterium]